MKPQPRHITFIRHAESIANVDNTTHHHTPDWKIRLSPHGVGQSVAAGLDLSTQFGLDRFGVYVSPYQRTRQTWDGLSRGMLPPVFVKEDPRLREQEWGNLRPDFDTEKVEKERDAFGPFFYRFTHGESGADVYDRCTGFLDTLYRDFEKDYFPSRILIVTHGFTMRVLLMRWLHWSVEHFHSLENPKNCQSFTLEMDEDGRYQLATPFPVRLL